MSNSTQLFQRVSDRLVRFERLAVGGWLLKGHEFPIAGLG